MTVEYTAQIKYALARGTHDSLPLEGGGGGWGTPPAARPSARSARSEPVGGSTPLTLDPELAEGVEG